MFMTSCPAEGDPRDKVAGFVSNGSEGSLGGLRTDGLDFLVDLVADEIARQEPDSRVIRLDRDYLSDNGIDFGRDLTAEFQRRTSEGGRVVWLVVQDLPINDWQKSLEALNGKDTQVFFFTTACRQVPCCFKLINN